jgi:O-antigen/teichoic acid export membrane protein
MARALGPDEFGKLAYFVWLTGIIVILFNNGITVTLIRFLAESVGEKNISKAQGQENWLNTALWLCIAVIATVVLVAHRHLGLEIESFPLVVVTIALVAAAAAKSIYIFDVSKAKGHGEFNIESKSSSVLAISSLVVVGIIYTCDGQLVHYLLAFLLASILHPFLSRYLLRNSQIDTIDYSLQYKPDNTFLNHLYWSTLLCIVSLSANRTVETYLLNAYYQSSDVGKFIVAATLSRAGLDLVSVGMNAVLMPVLGHGLGSGGQEQVYRLTQRAVKYMLFLGLLFSGTCFFFADSLVAMLYGNSFVDSAFAFKILVISGGLTLTSGAFGAYLSTTNRQKQRALIAIGAAIIQGITAVIFVPKFGLWGAIASTSIGGLFLTFILCHNCAKYYQLPLQASTFLIIFGIFFALMIMLIFFNQYIRWEHKGVTTGILFSILFVTLSLIFGIWTKSDIRMARELFSNQTLCYRFISYLEKFAGRNERI